ncbi:hypothetical protein MFIFM68171_02189 [Madurella fahalii]|uniref:Uncharacterized protein n=1 Tax=Madurella fahalii TaxID=1157608 RepID=A0ABQ0G2N9_9PEZI
MILTGPGKWLLPTQSGHGQQNPSPSLAKHIFDEVGSGTQDDPTVAWRFDPSTLPNFDDNTKRAHVEIAREVARRNGFNCVIIRTQAHRRQYKPAEKRKGNQNRNQNPGKRETIPADLHITVFMGPNTHRAWVGGHIYVVAVKEPNGRTAIRQMDDPANQRCIIPKGLEKVSEEFWFERRTWLKGYRP